MKTISKLPWIKRDVERVHVVKIHGPSPQGSCMNKRYYKSLGFANRVARRMGVQSG